MEGNNIARTGKSRHESPETGSYLGYLGNSHMSRGYGEVARLGRTWEHTRNSSHFILGPTGW